MTHPTPTELLALADALKADAHERRQHDASVGMFPDEQTAQVFDYYETELRRIATTLSAREDDAKDAARWRFMANEENIHNPSRINAVVNELVENGGSWTDKATWDTAIDSMLAKAPTAGEGK